MQNSTFQHRNVKKCFVQWLRATQQPIQNTCFLARNTWSTHNHG